MGRPNLMEQFGIEVQVDPEQLVDNLAGTPPAFNEDAYSDPNMVVDEHRVAMEQLDEACVMFEALHNAGGINQMYAVALEDLDGYKRRAAPESYSPNLSDKNYQVSMEGLFSAIGTGLKKFWEMIKSFFRWLFGLDRKSKAEKLRKSLEEQDARVKEFSDRLKENLEKATAASRAKTDALVKQVDETIARVELSSIARKNMPLNNTMVDEKTWQALSNVSKELRDWARKHKDDARADQAVKMADRADQLLSQGKDLQTKPDEGYSVIHRARIMLENLERGRLAVAMKNLRAAITDVFNLFQQVKFVSVNWNVTEPPTEEHQKPIVEMRRQLKLLEENIDRYVKPVDFSGGGGSTTLDYVFAARTGHAISSTEKTTSKLLEDYEKGWETLADRNKAVTKWLDNNKTLSEQLIADLEKGGEESRVARAAWVKVINEERDCFSYGLKVLGKATKFDSLLLNGFADIGKIKELRLQLVKYRLSLIALEA